MKLPINQTYIIYFTLMVLGVSGIVFPLFMGSPLGFYAFIALAGVAGGGVASHIAYTKRHGKQLVCPSGGNCNVVVNSKYSKFMGIPLEYMGIVYYFSILCIYIALVAAYSAFSETALLLILLYTAGAFLFSSYLLFVQGFLLRAWCIWCLLASGLSMAIFIMSLVSLGAAMEFLVDIAPILEAIHSLGFVIGMGGASVAAFLFFRFLRDFTIDDEEMGALHAASEIVWVGLWITLLSQFAFFVSRFEAVVASPLFLAQTVALLVVVVSGAVLLIVFAPFLIAIPFEQKEHEKENFLTKMRKVIFINGAVALASWYFAFAMDFIPDRYSSLTLFAAYGAVLALAVILALVWESAIKHGKIVKHPIPDAEPHPQTEHE